MKTEAHKDMSRHYLTVTTIETVSRKDLNNPDVECEPKVVTSIVRTTIGTLAANLSGHMMKFFEDADTEAWETLDYFIPAKTKLDGTPRKDSEPKWVETIWFYSNPETGKIEGTILNTTGEKERAYKRLAHARRD